MSDAGLLFFSFPNAPERRNLDVWLSYDDHATWSAQKTIHAGPSYYSNLEALPDGTAMVIYGRDGTHCSVPARTVVARFNLEWLTGSRDSLAGGSLRT